MSMNPGRISPFCLSGRRRVSRDTAASDSSCPIEGRSVHTGHRTWKSDKSIQLLQLVSGLIRTHINGKRPLRNGKVLAEET